jgi:hypothetical protein
MLVPYTEKQKVSIVNNIVKAATKDITSLNKMGYKFISLANGFIAHYDINGFITVYSHQSLARDIISFAGSNQWNNFREGDRDYAYYMSKKDIYQRIVNQLI